MSVVQDLEKLLPGMRVSDAPADRILYARDLWPRELIRLRAGEGARPGPLAVAWPESARDAVRILEYARETGTPIVPYGAGSGVCGGIAPDQSALVVDLKRFSDFVISPESNVVDVGAGMLGITLEEELQARGYTVGHFPSSILCSTVGGWLAARGAGQCSGLYGKIEDMVVGADCVLGDASLLSTSWRQHGPNLAPLLVGSEGTLGVILRARLRLHKLPEARVFSAFEFRSMQAGWQALREIYQSGLRPAVARLYDPLDTWLNSTRSNEDKRERMSHVMRGALRIPEAINRAVRALEGNLLDQCRLILIFEGQNPAALEDSTKATRLCVHHAARELGEAPARAWLEHRYSVSYRQSPIFRMGAFSDTMEVAAPWSKLEQVYDDVRRALGRHVVVLSHVSHVYPDGCSIYFTFSAAADSDSQALAVYDRLWPLALEAAVAAGATLSHHHGVGRSKAPVLPAELGYALTLLSDLKRAWDPDGVLNPGALLPKDLPQGVEFGADNERLVLDRTSLLADMDASLTLDESENLLARQGYTLALEQQGSLSLAEWLARGMPGSRSPWEDPVDHTLVGLSAEVHGKAGVRIAPAPRRSVGPDLTQFFIGERRVGRVRRVTLRVEPAKAPRSRSLPGNIESQPLSDAEARAWERAVAELSHG